MRDCNIFSTNLSQQGASMLFSRIEPDHCQYGNQNKYIIHKIPRANKKVFQDYQQRSLHLHPHVPNILIQSTSVFYHSVYIEQCSLFALKDLLMLPLNKRINFLTELLSAVAFLAKLYGFFYITEKMIGYNQAGKITLWINEDSIENKRSYPINHGRLSEQIFVSDFKAGFGGSLRELCEFKKVTKIGSLINLLSKDHNSIGHSVYLSEPPHRASYIHRRDSNIVTSQLDYQQNYNFSDRGSAKNHSHNPYTLGFNQGFEYKDSLNTLKKATSISYIPNQLEQQMFGSQKRMSVRALSSSVSMQNLQFRAHTHNRSQLNTSGKSINYSKIINNSSSLKTLTHSIIPKIQFSYRNPDQNIGWKKKIDTQNKQDQFSSPNLAKSQSSINFSKQAIEQLSKEPLKISFPHTTTHTFVPFASNGNISLNFKQSTKFENKAFKLVKQELRDSQIPNEQHISQQSNQIEMDLDGLFSDSDGLHSKQEMQQMEMIMEQFGNLLL